MKSNRIALIGVIATVALLGLFFRQPSPPLVPASQRVFSLEGIRPGEDADALRARHGSFGLAASNDQQDDWWKLTTYGPLEQVLLKSRAEHGRVYAVVSLLGSRLEEGDKVVLARGDSRQRALEVLGPADEEKATAWLYHTRDAELTIALSGDRLASFTLSTREEE